jgi:hypothetical protein
MRSEPYGALRQPQMRTNAILSEYKMHGLRQEMPNQK